MLAVKRVVAMRCGSSCSASCAPKRLYVSTTFVKSVKKNKPYIAYDSLYRTFPREFNVSGCKQHGFEERCVSVHLRHVRVSIPGHFSILWTTDKNLQIWRRNFFVECWLWEVLGETFVEKTELIICFLLFRSKKYLKKENKFVQQLLKRQNFWNF